MSFAVESLLKDKKSGPPLLWKRVPHNGLLYLTMSHTLDSLLKDQVWVSSMVLQ